MTSVIISDATRQYAHNLDDLRQRWNIRREEPTDTEWMPVDLFREKCASLEYDDLIEIRQNMLEINHRIIGRIEKAKRAAKKSGIYAEEKWFNEILFCKKSISRHLLVINDELSKRKRKFNHVRNNSFEQKFIKVSKELLGEEIFNEIVRLSK